MYKKEVEDSVISVEKVFLYGSYVHGEAVHESHTDIMLVFDSVDSDNPKTKAIVWGLTRKIDTRIEPYLVSMKRFLTDDVSPLLQIVKTEGKEILA